MKNKDNNKKIVLITGATSGIGYSFAKILADENNCLVLTASDNNKLLKCANDLNITGNYEIDFVPADLSLQGGSKVIIDHISRKYGGIDILIHCAGIGYSGDFEGMAIEKIIEIINVNILNTTLLLKDFFELAQKIKNESKIILVGSSFSQRPVPGWAVYASSKSYIENLALALIKEQKDSDIKIYLVSPCKTKTNFDKNAGVIKLSGMGMEPDYVAKYTMECVKKERNLIIPGMKNKLMRKIAGIFPGLITKNR